MGKGRAFRADSTPSARRAAGGAGRLALLLAAVLPLAAAARTPDKDYGWFGNVSFGAVVATGNTRVSNLTGRIEERYEGKQWYHTLQASLLRNEADGQRTAERYTAEYKLLYKYYPQIDLFFSTRAVRDELAGYRHQFFHTVGYRHTLLETLWDRFAFEVGAGLSQQTRVDGRREERAVGRLALDYGHDYEGGNRLRASALGLLGRDNTNLTGNVALTSRLVGALGVELSVKVSHNSRVSAGKRHTDTTTSLALVYDFW